MAIKPLSGLKILVTRPAAQADNLAKEIVRAGGEPLLFPVISIQPTDAENWPKLDWQQIDKVFFVSRNAVHCFQQYYPAPLPDNVALIAVGGAGTAEAMQQCGYPVAMYPLEPGGSEALLKQMDITALNGQNTVIVRGNGGRDLLADALRANGATVRYIEAYQRQLPTLMPEQRQVALTADMVMATSVQSVVHLCELLGDTVQALYEKPLVVVSERIKAAALSQGFEQVEVTMHASDDAIMQQLINIGQRYGKK